MTNNPEQAPSPENNDYGQEEFDHDWQKYMIDAEYGSTNIRPDEYIAGMQRFSQAYANGMRPTNPVEDSGDIKYGWKYPYDEVVQSIVRDSIFTPHWHPKDSSAMNSATEQPNLTIGAHWHTTRQRLHAPPIEELGDQQIGSQPQSALQKKLEELREQYRVDFDKRPLWRLLLDGGDSLLNPAYREYSAHGEEAPQRTFFFDEAWKLLAHPRIEELDAGRIGICEFVNSVRAEEGLLDPMPEWEQQKWNTFWEQHTQRSHNVERDDGESVDINLIGHWHRMDHFRLSGD
jgi:hypothetical protein